MMKSKYFTWLPILGVLLPAALRAQSCAPITNPNPYISTNPTAPIEAYLARAISFDGLHNDVGNAKWQEDVTMAVQLKAAILLRAAGLWGHDERYESNHPATYPIYSNKPSYTDTLRAAVTKINNSYDCAGLRRPLIQACVFTEEVSAYINHIPIEQRVINAFSDQIPPDQYTSYYDPISYGPRGDVLYDYDKIVTHKWSAGDGTPDVTKLQARMWIYQQALYYIDAGFTSLHMGQVNLYGTLAEDVKTNTYSAEYKLALVDTVMRRIRHYAAALPNGRGFYPILMAEGGKFDGGSNIKYVDGKTNGVDNLIFDCNTAAARPRETYSQSDTRRLTGPNCPAAVTDFTNTPCAGNTYMATIDACHGGNMLPDGGGITPSGRVFADGATAYTVYLDFTDDNVHDASNYNQIVPHGDFTPSWNGTWGYDDARWFTQELQAPCRGAWMQAQLKSVRGFVESKSFFQATGRVNGDTGIGSRYNRSGQPILPYRLHEDASTLQAIQEAWTVLDAAPSYVTQNAYTGTPCTFQNTATGSTDPAVLYPSDPTGNMRCANLLMTVTAPDATSIYTWHIQRPDNSWEPLTYGVTRSFFPTAPGTYHVTLKQDNLGLSNNNPARTYPTYEFTTTAACYCEATQASIRATTPLATTAERLQSMPLTVAPVPTTGKVLVQFTSSTALAVTGSVSDVMGRRVLTVAPQVYQAAGTHALELDLETLATGVYNCQLLLNGSPRNVKLVKN